MTSAAVLGSNLLSTSRSTAPMTRFYTRCQQRPRGEMALITQRQTRRLPHTVWLHEDHHSHGRHRARCAVDLFVRGLGIGRWSKGDSTSSTWSLERSEKEWDEFGVRYEEGFAPVDELEGSKDVKAFNEACKDFAAALRVNAKKATTGKWPGELKGKMIASPPSSRRKRRRSMSARTPRRSSKSRRGSGSSAGTQPEARGSASRSTSTKPRPSSSSSLPIPVWSESYGPGGLRHTGQREMSFTLKPAAALEPT